MSEREGGWSYVELLASMVILVVGLLALATAYHSSSRLAADNQDNATLNVASRNVMEALRRVPLSYVTEEFGPGSQRNQFWCAPDGTISFSPRSDAVSVGRINFFVNESLIPYEFADLYGGFDLNANGVIDSGPVSDYKILPVRIRLKMDGPSGPRFLEVHHILCESESW